MDFPRRANPTVARSTFFQTVARFLPFSRQTEAPAVFHVTHAKAGSQWIYKILLACVPERIVTPLTFQEQFLEQAPEPGKVYPTLYVTKQQFEARPLPRSRCRFVVIRDLRDTLVSAYFSIKFSHPDIGNPLLGEMRATLEQRSVEDGFLFLLDCWLPESAAIQSSWCAAGEPLIRYEELLSADLSILSRVLLRRCRLEVPARQFAEIVQANRFEQVTGGRRRGREDLAAHERKGIAGDWRNHFTPRVVRAFKDRYSRLLIDTGYERNRDW